MKKNSLLLLCLIALATVIKAQNGLENIIVEKYYVSNTADANGSIGTLPNGSTTYRIYVDMLPGYKFQAAYGVPNHTLLIKTTTNYFNNEDYGATTAAFSKTNAAKNSVMLDSWFSAGGACTGNYGILKSEDDGVNNVVNNTVPQILQNTDPAAGIPLTTQDGLIAGTPEAVTFVGLTTELDAFDGTSQLGNMLITTNGSWASLNGSTGPTAANKVLIGQFTTNGCFSFELNIQIGTPTGGVQNYVARNPVGNEILLPSLTYNLASVTIAASPSGPVCSGASITFTATPVNGGTIPVYQWKKGSTIVGTNSPTYTVSNLTNGSLIKCVMTSNASVCGTTTATSNTITANISPLPTATITPTGPTTFCSGANACTLNAPAGTGNIYQWKKGATSLSGATNSSYVPTSTSTQYKVVITNSNGCSKTSPVIAITVNPLPIATNTPTGPTTFCSGQNLCTLNANSGTGLTYQWKKGTTSLAGATNISYVPTATNTQYKVVVTDANACSKTSPVVAITVNALPTATITAQGPTTFCAGDSVVLTANSGAGLSYQWIKGTSNLSGATLINYTAKTAGTYKVNVTNVNGCAKTSAGKIVTVNCREGIAESESDSRLIIFPNPAHDVFTLKINDSNMENGAARIEISNVLGQTVYSTGTEVADGELIQQIIPGSDWSKGMYFVRVLSGDVTYEGKVLFE
jgi:hypothetical protein